MHDAYGLHRMCQRGGSGTGGSADGSVLARSRVVLVFFDTATQRSVMPPEGYREALMEAVEGLRRDTSD